MKLNDALNVVIPVRSDESGARVHAYHIPISREVFEANYRHLAATKAHLAGKGIYYQMDSGPRIAAMVLRDEVRRDAETAGDLDDSGKPSDKAAVALFAEIKRLTTILAPTANGWESIPVDRAIQTDAIDREEWDEALSALVFFTCHYALGRKVDRPRIAEATASLLRASITSSPLSEYASSLARSMQAAPSVVKVESSETP